MNKVPEISLADYNTILLHAEKISNGQHDFATVLRRELCEKLNIADAESLIADLMTNKDVEFLNRVRLFLSQFPFVVEGEDGTNYQLVKRRNFCELDLVEQSSRELEEREVELIGTMENGKAENLVDEEVKLEVRAERIRRLQADVQRGIIEIGFELIAAKKQVGHGSWSDWLQKEFEWSVRTAQNFMGIAERFGKTKSISFLSTTTLIKMLALPEGDEQAFIDAQAQAGTPVENQSARQVQAAVKKWKREKQKKSPPPFEEINLFQEVEDEPNPDFELNSTPTEEGVDDTADELSQAQIHENNSPLEISTVNSDKEKFDDELNMMRTETRKILAEISERIQRATRIELADTIQVLKSVCDLLN